MPAQNRKKLTPLLSAKYPNASPLPPCPCGHNLNFEKSEVFCTKKCGCTHLKSPPLPCLPNVRIEQILLPPLNTDIFYGQSLINKRLSLPPWWWWYYPTPSEGWGRGGTPRRPNSRGIPKVWTRGQKWKKWCRRWSAGEARMRDSQ